MSMVPKRGSVREILGRGKKALSIPSKIKPTEIVMIKNRVESPPLSLTGVSNILCKIYPTIKQAATPIRMAIPILKDKKYHVRNPPKTPMTPMPKLGIPVIP
jgi:hypothetical protein